MKKKETSSRATAIMIMVTVVSFITFMVLKICGVIGWPWWWITVPIWGLFAITLLALGFMALCVVILSIAAKHRRK